MFTSFFKLYFLIEDISSFKKWSSLSKSTFPPLTTATTSLFLILILLNITAATLTAPDGSTNNFARSSTGDGFYIWNRDLGATANANLYHLMHLVLADNAIARTKANGRTVPLLRAAFHVGSCYEFHQAEGLNPTVFSDIVGDAHGDRVAFDQQPFVVARVLEIVGNVHEICPVYEAREACL